MDVEQPPSDLWNKIRDEWKKEEKPASTHHWWKVAAIVFISTSLTLLIYSLSLQNKVEQLASLGDISEEYMEMENQYKAEIGVLESSIKNQKVNLENDFQWIADEMKTLEEINELYRRDIGQVANQAQLTGALIDYYEKKIKLLKKLELEINRTKKFNDNEKDDTDTISI